MDVVKIAAAFRALADAFEAPPPAQAPDAPAPAGTPRGRGRPPKVEATPVVPPTAAPAGDDPFATAPAAPVVPAATLDEVRAALTALRAASTQETALAVLKTVGEAASLTELKPEKYGAVVAAARGHQAPKPEAMPEPDPFEVPAVVAKALTLEDVKAAVVAAQKKTGTDTVQAVVMQYGGKAASPEGGAMMPSLKALPEGQFAAVIKALADLPNTK